MIYHIVCDLRIAPLQLKILAKPMPESKKFLCLVILLFNQSKKQCCPRAENRTFSRACRARGQELEIRSQGQGLQKMCPRKRPRYQGRP